MDSSEIASPSPSVTNLAVMKQQHLLSSEAEAGSQAFPSFNDSTRSRSGSVSRMSRTFSRTSRRSGGGSSSSFMSAHRRQMSAELTAQAEAKFTALMDIMASASREAASLRESWSRILSEREAFNSEREDLLEQITEVSGELEQSSSNRNQHGDELVQRKKQVETLLSELSIAVTSVTAEKKRLVERDLELQRTRDELRLVAESSSRTKIDLERIRSEYETLEMTLTTTQVDRDGAREESAKHHRDLHKAVRERTETTARLAEVTTSYELSRKEVLSLADRIKMYDLEREENFQEMTSLKEETRKARNRADESSKDLVDVTEKHERATREVHKLRETIRIIETERDDHLHTIEHKSREVKSLTVARDETQERYTDLTVKYEHIKREVLALKQTVRDVELERNEHLENAERSREQYRLLAIERDEVKDEVTTVRARADDSLRQLTLLTANLRKTEQTLADARSESFAHIERVKLVEQERDNWRGKHTGLVTELSELRERLVIVQTEVRTIGEARDAISLQLARRNEEFEEITETITSSHDESAELEFEIESLRAMLRETREQKERAIAARNTADRERDEAIAKYEEQCRTFERFEEEAASHYHAQASASRSGGESRTTTTRMVSRSGAASASANGSTVSTA